MHAHDDTRTDIYTTTYKYTHTHLVFSYNIVSDFQLWASLLKNMILIIGKFKGLKLYLPDKANMLHSRIFHSPLDSFAGITISIQLIRGMS